MLSVGKPGAPAPAALQELEDQDSLDLSDETKSQCRISVIATLPDIDPEYLTRVCTEAQWDPNRVIDRIFDQVENGEPYPRVPKPNSLKRKREDDDEASDPNNPAAKFDNEERRRQGKATSYKKTCDAIMQQSFPDLYADDLRRTLAEHGNCLYPAFLAVTATVASINNRPPYRKKSRATQISGRYGVDALADRIRTCVDQGEREALEEFQAVTEFQSKKRAESEVERKRDADEKANLEAAMLEGNVADCGCCFVEYALNRMIHCDGEVLHWFCRDCARTMAETQIGLSKYRLDCMSTDGCTGGFALDQKEIFLDGHSMTALDRIEQEAVLREAGIENLETCPLCPFAAEYPPIEEDKEFRCLNPDCAVTSCRSCRKETHVPKTCAEAALDNGHSARHEIEEAMSAALIRMCNKCQAPFIKENGCNKMTCTKCRNIQCYVCSKSCDYSHFNDASRGGKTGNCPLFDDGHGVEKRHREEVRVAEEKARKRALEMHPEVQAELLEFRLSEKVKKDEEEKASAPQHPIHHRHHHHHRLGGRLGRLVRLNIGLERPVDHAPGQAQPQPPRPPPLPAAAAAAAAFAAPDEHQEWQLPAVNAPVRPMLNAPRAPPAVAAPRRRPHAQPPAQPRLPAPVTQVALPPAPRGNMFSPRSQGRHAQIAAAPGVPAFQGADLADLWPQDQVPPIAQRAPQAQVQPFIDPRAVFGQPQAPGVGLWDMVQNMQPAALPVNAMDQAMAQFGGLYDHYRQSEHPMASPVSNGRAGDANQIDHRIGTAASAEPAMNDPMGLWDAGGHLGMPEDLANMAMNLGDIERRPDDLEYASLIWPDFDFAQPQFGLDDLAFR
ncbi:hypothetical protein N8I77_000574 [Diaporthe amygdali]|uniref:RING-type domain-containing protein n=1 Tax=Phomopsis amygdali TaxID=1214568 RepID=A0AAD9W981_PHOAM|nr:hypothetical protein N8I77_000574 [Diaporthe amygdali]